MKKYILSKYKKNKKILSLKAVKSYKIIISFNLLMDFKRKNCSSNTLDFFSKEMVITRKSLNENQLKYSYQKQLILDLDHKHKEWSEFVDSKI